MTFLEKTAPWRRKLREVEYGSLSEHRTILEQISPIHKANRIKAPLLLIHGRNDERVPVYETELISKKLTHSDVQVRVPNIKKLSNLGYVPKIRLEEGLTETIKWYRKIQSWINAEYSY